MATTLHHVQKPLAKTEVPFPKTKAEMASMNPVQSLAEPRYLTPIYFANTRHCLGTLDSFVWLVQQSISLIHEINIQISPSDLESSLDGPVIRMR